MENTLFSCMTRDSAQLAWTQLALTHFGSENSSPNSSMATMESRRGGLPWPLLLLQNRSSFAFAILTHSPVVLQNLLSCRFFGILKQSTALLPYNFGQKVFPTVWISHVAADAPASVPSPIWSRVTPPALGHQVSSLGSPTCCSPCCKGTT